MVNRCLVPDLDKGCKLSIPSKYSIRDWIVTLFEKFFIMYSFALSICTAVILNWSFLQDFEFASFFKKYFLSLMIDLQTVLLILKYNRNLIHSWSLYYILNYCLLNLSIYSFGQSVITIFLIPQTCFLLPWNPILISFNNLWVSKLLSLKSMRKSL